MGKNNKKSKKKVNTKGADTSKKGSSKKEKSSVINGKDPIAVRVVFSLFILFMILSFMVGAFSVMVLSDTREHDGMLYLGTKYYTQVNDIDSNLLSENIYIFDSDVAPTKNSTVLFTTIKEDFGQVVYQGVFTGEKNGNLQKITVKRIINGQNADKNFFVPNSCILGTYADVIEEPILISIISNKFIFLIVFAGFIAFTFVLGLLYYLVSPRGAKQHDKEEKKVVQMVTTVNSENSEILSHYLSSDDNIQPLDKEQNEVGALLNINYYNSVRLHNGEVYAVVKKYQESVRRLEQYGASDMDIIRMNMIGNSEFDDLILNTHKEKTMSMWEIIDFARTLDGVYCVKKRGTLNWTYKYKSKTLFIVKRESDDSESYKVAIKVYPDAANKLNIIYKALEDSSFPNGPYWYMFNDLRNLPANVIKWLMTESLNISKWQQIKADLLKDTPDLASYKLDTQYMRDMVLAATKELDMGKFTIITQINSSDETKYNTVLETGFDDMNMDQFTKEITMMVPGGNNIQMSILTRKNASEALVNSLCNELLDFSTPKDAQAMNPNNMNIINQPSQTTVVKKSKKKK